MSATAAAATPAPTALSHLYPEASAVALAELEGIRLAGVEPFQVGKPYLVHCIKVEPNNRSTFHIHLLSNVNDAKAKLARWGRTRVASGDLSLARWINKKRWLCIVTRRPGQWVANSVMQYWRGVTLTAEAESQMVGIMERHTVERDTTDNSVSDTTRLLPSVELTLNNAPSVYLVKDNANAANSSSLFLLGLLSAACGLSTSPYISSLAGPQAAAASSSSAAP